MQSGRSTAPFAAISLLLVALAGCLGAPDDPTPADPSAPANLGAARQALGLCANDCTTTTSCDASCYVDGANAAVRFTCGSYGRCASPASEPICVLKCVERGPCPPGMVCTSTTCLKWQTICF